MLWKPVGPELSGKIEFQKSLVITILNTKLLLEWALYPHKGLAITPVRQDNHLPVRLGMRLVPCECGEKPVVYNKNRYELNWEMSGIALLSKGKWGTHSLYRTLKIVGRWYTYRERVFL